VALTRPCTLFPHDNSTGELNFAWHDGTADPAGIGVVGPGDGFTADYADCWVDEPGAADPWVRSGTVSTTSYWEDRNPIVLGFDPVVLTDVVETDTRTAGGNTDPGETVTAGSFGVSGQAGFRLLVFPDTSTAINVNNAATLAGRAVNDLRLPREIGDLGLGLTAGLVGDPSFRFCDVGGTYAVTPTPTAATPVPADFAASFSGCERGAPDVQTVDGAATIHVESVAAAVGGGTLAPLVTDDYEAAVTLDGIAVTTTDSVGTSSLTGASRFTRTAVGGDFTETAEDTAGGLDMEEAGVTRVLTPYTVHTFLGAAGEYAIGQAGDVLTDDPSDVAGALTVTVVQAVQGTDPAAPASGVIRIGAADGSTLTLTVNAGAVRLEVDTNGDGTPDDTLTTTWADLD
jgi:hypothetical protein